MKGMKKKIKKSITFNRNNKKPVSCRTYRALPLERREKTLPLSLLHQYACMQVYWGSRPVGHYEPPNDQIVTCFWIYAGVSTVFGDDNRGFSFCRLPYSACRNNSTRWQFCSSNGDVVENDGAANTEYIFHWADVFEIYNSSLERDHGFFWLWKVIIYNVVTWRRNPFFFLGPIYLQADGHTMDWLSLSPLGGRTFVVWRYILENGNMGRFCRLIHPLWKERWLTCRHSYTYGASIALGWRERWLENGNRDEYIK